LAIGRLRGDEKQRVQRGTEAVVVSASACCGPAVGLRVGVGVGGGSGLVAGGSGKRPEKTLSPTQEFSRAE